MSEELLDETLKRIKKPDAGPGERIHARLDNLTKPRGSLGRLEQIAKSYAIMRGADKVEIPKKVTFVFAADHGVADEGVSAYPKSVTYQMVLNFLNGGAGINVLARHAGAGVRVVDIGVDHDFAPRELKRLISKKIMHGTNNFTKGPAMPRDKAVEAMKIGIELSIEEIEKGAGLIGVGDMGISNTTASSAITAFMTGKPVENVTGRGTGIDDGIFKKKVEVIKRAIDINKPNQKDPVDVLSKLGGLEIAGIAGVILGAASRQVPVVLDGFITGAGALIAGCLNFTSKEYMFASHVSVEKGHMAILEWLGLTPILDLNLRLGEGTGAVLAMTIIDASIKILNEMATFDSAGVDKDHKA